MEPIRTSFVIGSNRNREKPYGRDGFWRGHIASFRVYDRILKQSEINALACEFRPAELLDEGMSAPLELKASTILPTVYTPLLKFCGRKCNISEDDLEDLVQMVMLRFHKAQESFCYDQSKGHFRSYLGRVIHSAISELKHSRVKNAGELPEDVADSQEDWVAKLTEDEWKNYLQENALPLLRQRVNPTTYQAFKLYVLKGKSPQLVAQFLDIEVTQGYNAKARCQRMLQEIVQTLEG